MTAANSTPLPTRLGGAVLEDYAEAQGWEPLAYFTAYETAAVDYVHGGEGLLMAPAYAIRMPREGLKLQDFDFYEIHEAFASQVLATLKVWDDPVFCERLGLDEPLGTIDRPSSTSPAPRLPRGTRSPPPVADRGDAGQAAGRRGGRRDLDLRRRRPGRHRDPGALSPGPRRHQGASQ